MGTRVIFAGAAAILYKLRERMIDDNLRTFLEAIQFLAITGESVLRYTYPCCSVERLEAILKGIAVKGRKASMAATVSTCLQAVVRCCPLAAVRDIYGKLTLLIRGIPYQLLFYALFAVRRGTRDGAWAF